MKLEGKITKIVEKTIDSESISHETIYQIEIKNSEGSKKVTIVSDEPFLGFIQGEDVKVNVKTNQKTLKEATKMPETPKKKGNKK